MNQKKNQSRNQTKKNKRSRNQTKKNNKRGGGVMTDVLREASKLAAPVVLVLARDMVRTSKNKKNSSSQTGGFVNSFLKEASKLAVPVVLVGARGLLKSSKNKQRGGLNLYSQNMDCGAPFHPVWNKNYTPSGPVVSKKGMNTYTFIQEGGKKKRRNRKN